MAIDPVCKMEVQEAKAAATSEYKERNTTSVLLAVRRLSTRTLRSTSPKGSLARDGQGLINNSDL